MLESGYVKLHRRIKLTSYGQLRRDPNAMHLFINLILDANIAPRTLNNGVKLERGQLFIGLRKYAESIGLTHQTTRTALKNLKNMEILTHKSTHKGTLITICNYSTYQDSANGANTETNNKLTQSQHSANTLPNNRIRKQEEKNIKNNKNKHVLEHDDVRVVWEHYLSKLREPDRWKFTDQRKRLIGARLKHFSVKMLKSAIDGVFLHEFNRSKGYTGIEVAFKNGQLERYAEVGERGVNIPMGGTAAAPKGDDELSATFKKLGENDDES